MNQNTEQCGFIEPISLYIKNDADKSVIGIPEKKLNLRILHGAPCGTEEDHYLLADADGLALVENGCSLRGDFSRLLPRLAPHNLGRELLIKASRIKEPKTDLTAVDATAGLGEDAFLLAAAGFHVRLYERNPVIAALLSDALRRAKDDPDLTPIVRRMELHTEDSIAMLPRLGFSPDIVLLDPMFPPRHKSGLIRKKFQMLHRLELPCSQENDLLQAAISCHPRKIVIKRPLKGPYLAGIKPGYSLNGRAIRYDCIVVPSPPSKEQTDCPMP